ncbi:MAG: hypothetical protein J7M30_17235 [Deltaproteobacteria bacterium]|nr:hypothetical protein [Deltaproteobacteria bacterium]
MEGKIIEKLAKQQEIHAETLRTTEEEHNFAIALQFLLSKKEITEEKDHQGFTIYKLVA